MTLSDDEDNYLNPYEAFTDEDVCHVVVDHQNKKFFTILTKEDLLSRIEDDVLKLSSLISIPREAARILLCRYNWNINSIRADWLANQETFKSAYALSTEKPEPMDVEENNFVCRVCCGEYSVDVAVVTSPACRHVFCKTCWKNYINKSINNGLMLTCPEGSCGAAVGRRVINSLASDGDKRRYDDYVVRSYVESREDIKLCPTSDCGCVVEYCSEGRGSRNFDVTCSCFYSFCWSCLGEAHSPVDCETAAKWTATNSSDMETQNWLLANNKPCPQREKARDLWGYYERWYNNHYSRERAFLDLNLTKNVNLVKLSEILGFDETYLWFIVDAWIQMVECRRVLKWACVKSFYLAQNEHKKKEFFEYLLSQAEAVCKRLHHCTDRELFKYLQAERPLKDEFSDFRTKLSSLTRVTRIYFDNLVKALENDFSDMDLRATTSSKDIKATTSSKKIKPE